MAENPIKVSIEADTAPLRGALRELEQLSQSFGAQLTGALKNAAVGGRDLESVLKQIGLNLAGLALSQGLKPLQGLVGSLFGSLAGGLSAALPGAPGGVVPFAAGGVVSAPTYFPVGGALGLAGEAGPEAILPLTRGADGRLGSAQSAEAAASMSCSTSRRRTRRPSQIRSTDHRHAGPRGGPRRPDLVQTGREEGWANSPAFTRSAFRSPSRSARAAGRSGTTRSSRLTSGRERRNLRLAQSRRRFDAGTGVRSLDDLYEVIAFFEARRGSLLRLSLARPARLAVVPAAGDARPARPGDRHRRRADGDFQLTKTYGERRATPIGGRSPSRSRAA